MLACLPRYLLCGDGSSKPPRARPREVQPLQPALHALRHTWPADGGEPVCNPGGCGLLRDDRARLPACVLKYLRTFC